jgi:hypothetical protein
MAKTSSLPPMSSSGTVLAGLAVLLLGLIAQVGCNKSNESASNSPSNSATTDVVGKRIEFKSGGNSEPYRVSGWSTTETEFTWSEGTSAKMAFGISPAAGGLSLKIIMAALIHEPELPFQPVEVYANGQKIVEWQVGNTAEFVATIPGQITKNGGMLDIEFRTPKAASPKALGLSSDLRVLGICVRSMELVGSS